MTLYVLTCVSENYIVYSQSIHTTWKRADNKLLAEYDEQRKQVFEQMEASDKNSIIKDEFCHNYANLEYKIGDNEPFQFHWQICEIDA